MTIVKIDGTHRLRSDAAGSRTRMRKEGLPAGGINSAHRYLATQIALFHDRYHVQWVGSGPYGDARWYNGKRYVRHSPKGMVAIPGTSKHTIGTALDMSTSSKAHAWMLRNAARHGWHRPIKSEPWHWEYDIKRDLVLKEIKRKAAAKAKARTTVKKIQKVLGVVQDGDPGKRTEAAWDALKASAWRRSTKARAKVRTIQGYLGVTRDGWPGKNTESAWVRLKRSTK